MQIKSTFENIDEFAVIAKKLLQKYPDFFGSIDLERVKCLAINNKQRSEKKKLWEMKAIPDFALPDCAYSYYGIIFLDDWTEMPDKIKHRLIATMLYAVAEEEGKVKPFDLKDYGPFVRTLGTDYLDSEDGQDPLTEDVKWVI